MVHRFLSTYPYLATDLGGLVIFLVLLTLSSGKRSLALVSGLLAAPFGLMGVVMVPAYWAPRVVWSVWNVSGEDLLFSFVTGGLAWLLAASFCRRPVTGCLPPRHILTWYTVFNGCGLATMLLFWRLGCDPMTAVLLSFAVGTVVHLTLRPGKWRLAVAGALGFGAIYLLLSRLWFVLAPDFVRQWTPTSPWSRSVGGLPLGEIAWAVGYGACWPLYMAFLFRTELESPKSAKRAGTSNSPKGAS